MKLVESKVFIEIKTRDINSMEKRNKKKRNKNISIKELINISHTLTNKFSITSDAI